MTPIQPLLVAEGPSDVDLLPIIDWVLRQHAGMRLVEDCIWWESEDAFSRETQLEDKLISTVTNYPRANLLFVHRDSDNRSPGERRFEINRKVEMAKGAVASMPAHICVIPVQETETWLLFNEPAIRKAADNPKGNADLKIPKLNDLEEVARPKELLNAALGAAKKNNRFDLKIARKAIIQHIDDFAPLRQLSAFAQFEADVAALLAGQFTS